MKNRITITIVEEEDGRVVISHKGQSEIDSLVGFIAAEMLAVVRVANDDDDEEITQEIVH
jgi:hypothetical protein